MRDCILNMNLHRIDFLRSLNWERIVSHRKWLNLSIYIWLATSAVLSRGYSPILRLYNPFTVFYLIRALMGGWIIDVNMHCRCIKGRNKARIVTVAKPSELTNTLVNYSTKFGVLYDEICHMEKALHKLFGAEELSWWINCFLIGLRWQFWVWKYSVTIN